MSHHITASFGPVGGNTRNSEGAFLRMKDGGIYFAFSRFTRSQNDDAPSDIAAIRSYDEGETWTEPETVITAASFGTNNIMSVSMLRMTNGDMGLFHIVKNPDGTTTVVLNRSRDEGKTFYRRVECTPSDRHGYYVLNNDRVIRLGSGRLLMPVTFHRGGFSSDPSKQIYFDGRGTACFFYSDDDGETWAEASDTVSAPFTGSDSGLQENGAVEKQNGILWGYSRTDRLCHYEYFSMDGGMRWTGAQPSRFSAPCSPLQIKRRPQTGALYAVWNPIPNYNGRVTSGAGWGRTPLVWAVSADDGKTWSEPRVIEGAEDHGYCYPALFFTDDGAMLAAYCAGGPEDRICLARLSIMKIGIDEGRR